MVMVMVVVVVVRACVCAFGGHARAMVVGLGRVECCNQITKCPRCISVVLVTPVYPAPVSVRSLPLATACSTTAQTVNRDELLALDVLGIINALHLVHRSVPLPHGNQTLCLEHPRGRAVRLEAEH
jgi:hypothetical protein